MPRASIFAVRARHALGKIRFGRLFWCSVKKTKKFPNTERSQAQYEETNFDNSEIEKLPELIEIGVMFQFNQATKLFRYLVDDFSIFSR